MEGKNEIICERISVIVPIYNTEKYLARCIEMYFMSDLYQFGDHSCG